MFSMKFKDSIYSIQFKKRRETALLWVNVEKNPKKIAKIDLCLTLDKRVLIADLFSHSKKFSTKILAAILLPIYFYQKQRKNPKSLGLYRQFFGERLTEKLKNFQI